jgi:hypothetical protein
MSIPITMDLDDEVKRLREDKVKLVTALRAIAVMMSQPVQYTDSADATAILRSDCTSARLTAKVALA